MWLETIMTFDYFHTRIELVCFLYKKKTNKNYSSDTHFYMFEFMHSLQCITCLDSLEGKLQNDDLVVPAQLTQ